MVISIIIPIFEKIKGVIMIGNDEINPSDFLGLSTNTKLYVVLASYSTMEWQEKNIVGIYSSKENAEQVSKLYIQKIEEEKKIPMPISETEYENRFDLPADRWNIYGKWMDKQDRLESFDCITIVECWLDAKNFSYE